MPIDKALVEALNRMCPAAQRIALGDYVTHEASVVTVNASNGQASVPVPPSWGTGYIVVPTLLSGPTTAIGCMITERSAGSATLLVYGVNTANGSRVAVDCSTTNATVAYLAIKTA